MSYEVDLDTEKERMIGVPKRCSYGQFKSGMETSFWLDICEELDDWLDDVRNRLEDHSVLLSDKELHRLGGNAEAIRKMKMIAGVMLGNFEHKQEIEKEASNE